MEIKLKCSDYTKNLNFKEAVKNVFDFNIGTALTEVVGISQSKEMKAFELLFNTFKTTNTQLKKELGQDILNKTIGLSVISAEFEIAIKNYFEQEIAITKDFFEDILKYNPSYLKESYKIFKLNLRELQIPLPVNFEYEYYSKYRDNLETEFQEKSDYYNELIVFFNNPIFNQNKTFDRQLVHYRSIKSFFINPLQPDIEECKESLKDLYIDPYFKIYKNNTDFRNEDNFEDFESPESKISIHTFLDKYFLKGIKYNDLKANYNMLFLLGQPGQGKTSFCYKVIYDYLENNSGLPKVPLYFIKIRDLVAKDFINDTFNTINKHLCQNLSFEEDSCIIILDGLDEAYMAGGLNDNDLKNLYDRLNKTTQQNNDLKIILTSRLNYLRVSDPCLDKSLVCQLDILSDEQILLYAEKFKVFYPKNNFLKKIKKIIKTKRYIHIKELLQQAVLIYFVAITDIDIDEKDSKANLYDKFFDSLAKRNWDKQRGQLDYIKPKVKEDYKLYTKYLRRYIRSIAFEIYQSPNLYITLDKLSGLNSTKQFIKRCFNEDLVKSQEEIKEINKYLLISFYFQETNNKTNETAIEFFHNSLWEYLTAEYMWEENKNLLLKKEIDDEDEYENVSKDSYFALLNRLIGQKEFDQAIRSNLYNIIESEKNDIKRNVFNQSIKIFYKLSEDDFLLDYSSKNNSLSVLEKSISIFNLFWNFINISKDNFNLEINTNSNINRFLFSLSDLGTTTFNYINFDGDSYCANALMHEIVIKSKFNDFCNFKYIMENEIIDTDFNCCEFYYCIIRHNEFTNVNFIECRFYDLNFLESNSFTNVKFLNVEVPTEDWLDYLFKENILDEITKQNHTIESVYEETFPDTHELKFYIKYVGD
ncbi:NACHT domain-containing NTPase [Flavobacterium sp. ACN6]|uniref:NACHT domain-containing protein n=1 Tax=Flavobacterium sp. ACN6 TaxID=1920426 RepID=UPI000BB33C2C|nr:ATP-binding protein [Flavobacterium sp. ACN6]PBJ13974.1 ATPase family associated with various cellular activities (AAA) [Flavobacterium sp. ACN6]